MRAWAGIGCLLAGLAVAMGAFGAHGLRGVLVPEMMAVYEKSVFYHFIHAFAVLFTALAANHMNIAPRVGFLVCRGFGLGILLFCGSLYALAITGIGWLGAITPFGGMLWLLCWFCLGMSLLRNNSR